MKLSQYDVQNCRHPVFRSWPCAQLESLCGPENSTVLSFIPLSTGVSPSERILHTDCGNYCCCACNEQYWDDRIQAKRQIHSAGVDLLPSPKVRTVEMILGDLHPASRSSLFRRQPLDLLGWSQADGNIWRWGLAPAARSLFACNLKLAPDAMLRCSPPPTSSRTLNYYRYMGGTAGQSGPDGQQESDGERICPRRPRCRSCGSRCPPTY